jgi:hypothetical protein
MLNEFTCTLRLQFKHHFRYLQRRCGYVANYREPPVTGVVPLRRLFTAAFARWFFICLPWCLAL